MDIPVDLLTQFCRVTNADEAVASQLLRDSGLDLQTAIHSFFAIQEAQEAGANHTPPTDPTPDFAAPPDNPQPPSQSAGTGDALYDALHPNPAPQPPPAPVSAPPAIPPPAIIPPRHYDLQPHSADNPFGDPVSGDPRSEGLAALYKPPTHLVYPGSYEDVLDAGQAQNRWVLVNINRNDVFPCHSMNRDVWSDFTMQQLIAAHFLFWQRDEGRAGRYTQFYGVNNFPHIAVVDPRNHERVRVWGDNGLAVEKNVLIEQLSDFVSGNSLESDAVIRGSQARPLTRSTPSTSAPGPSSTLGATADSQMDEDAQLAAAISASMESSAGEDGGAAAPADVEPSTSNANGNGTVNSGRAVSSLLSATDPTLNKSRSLRAEQDDAFLESLALDRAREASNRSEQQRLENEQREMELKEKQRTERMELKRKRVPDAPPADTTEKVTELAIRLPDGKRVVRRFFASNNVGNVYDFIDTECESLGDVQYELMLAYPKKSYADREALLETLPRKAALVVHLKN